MLAAPSGAARSGRTSGPAALFLMSVLMMHIGNMRVRMAQAAMLVHVRMRLTSRIVRFVRVPMVLVMHMRMGVDDRLMHVLVLVMFAQMQPDAERHQCSGGDELQRDRFRERDDRGNGADEWRSGEIRS